MTRKIIYISFLLLLLADIGYSFLQHYNTSLDGDMAGGVVPANDVKQILESPLGLKVFRENKTYPNPNRFFSYWLFYKYFNKTPLFLQKIFTPIDSAYLSCAIAKTIIQIILIFLLAIVISGTTKILKLDFILAAILVAPLFQTNGYRNYMGIIDPSATYTFFYALPSALALLYFVPFFQQFYHKKKTTIQKIIKIFWIPLALVVCLSGPLNPGIVLIISSLFLLKSFIKNYSLSIQNGIIKKGVYAIRLIPLDYLFYLIPISIFSLYSLYVGRFNSVNFSNQIPLIELYSRLPEGIYYQFTQKLGFPVLFIILIINTVYIHNRIKTNEGQKILNIFKWIGIFALIYIILLPLGGYRNYRPYVLRYDTIMPITLSLMFIFGHSTLFLIKNISNRQKLWYLSLIALVLFIFTNSDKPEFDKNNCERMALKEISESSEKIVKLDSDCMVLSWNKIQKPEDSGLNARLLKLWRITNEKKLYYH